MQVELTSHGTGQGFVVNKATVSDIEIQVLKGTVGRKVLDDWGIKGINIEVHSVLRI